MDEKLMDKILKENKIFQENKSFKESKETIGNIYVADTFIKRFLGFMFRKKPHHQAIMFKQCNSIHTFFMRFNIDVIFLNEDMEVIKKVANLKPGKVIIPVKGAVAVIETEAGRLFPPQGAPD